MKVDINKSDLEEIEMEVRISQRLPEGGRVDTKYLTNEVIFLHVDGTTDLVIDLTAEYCKNCHSGIRKGPLKPGRPRKEDVLHFLSDCLTK